MALFGQSGKGGKSGDALALDSMLRLEDNARELAQLREKFDALALLVMERLRISEQEFEATLQRLRSERGKASTPVVAAQPAGDAPKTSAGPCPSCGRPRSARSGLCPYCGADKQTVEQVRKRFES